VEEGGTVSAELKREGERVEGRSAVFRKELGLWDLVLTQVVFVVGTIWVGTAARLGDEQLFFWLLAIATFYLPLAAVVIHLNRLMPLEGGLYQWAKLSLGEFVGFMVAVSTRGLGLGKWVHNAGGVLLLLTFLALIALPFISLWRGTISEYHPFAFAVPAFSLSNPDLLKKSLNIYSKLALGALTGFEYVAILAGECKTPARNIGRSVLIAAPLIAIMFILGTSSVLAFFRPEEVDLIGPIAQVLTRGFGMLGAAAAGAVSLVILAVVGRQVALMSIYLTANARLPMVAGWDGLLPAWFTRLHARHKTPVNSILLVGALSLGLGLLGLVGVGMQEAYQLLENAATIFYAITYVALFAIPLFGAARVGLRVPLWLRVAAVSGLLVSLLGIALTIVPIVDVVSPLAFAAKLIAVTLAFNLLGAWLYRAGRRRKSA
jgi:amino acid transporter